MRDKHGISLTDLTAALASQDRRRIVPILSAMIDERADVGRHWSGFANVLLALGELRLAWAALELDVATRDRSAKAVFNQASALATHGQVRRALDIVKLLGPDQLGSHQRSHFLGVGYSEIGQLDLARFHLEEAVKSAPSSGQSWLSLTVMTAMDERPDLFARLVEAHSRSGGGSAEEGAKFDYALSKAFSDKGSHRRAFDHASAGARGLRTIRRYDPEADAARVETIMIANVSVPSCEIPSNDDPIVVLGLPRSGTTLVEQILGRHSQVGGGGESNLFGLAAREIAARGETKEHLRELYLHLLDERFGVAGRKIDKSLGASRYLSDFVTVFPCAPILWIRRNPADVAWSNYRTYFARGMNWTLALESIGHHMRLEDRLYAHWRDKLGNRLMTVNYEELAIAPDGVIMALLDHCGLSAAEFGPATVRDDWPVATASVAQVRAPINRASIGAASPHGERMAPFFQSYDA